MGYEHDKRSEHASYCETQSVKRPERPVLARGHGAIGFVDLELLSRHEEQGFGADAGLVEAPGFRQAAAETVPQDEDARDGETGQGAAVERPEREQVSAGARADTPPG